MRPARVLVLASIAFCLAEALWLYWFVTAHGFSAREKPSKLEAVLARHARRIASPPGARELKNPLSSTPWPSRRRGITSRITAPSATPTTEAGKRRSTRASIRQLPICSKRFRRISPTGRSSTSSRMGFASPACRAGVERTRKTGSLFCSYGIYRESPPRNSS